ncbi:acyl-CoA dehydrogenase family protein [Streptomyces nanshensis]|uniref:Acyl-CoA dehydrogenase n=1 Tax=Streptomyces nanshensis TaxID=518642 RepID=A0A1E7L9X0_9ACTN|nr:acyl-CoA dehydrogenase family protein [Streptomyces nanshensis]OEV13007.1 acyl-CoA dehydrogenase [Streptomyces nanshensis]
MSDWFLSDVHKELRARVRAFAAAEVAPRVALMEAGGQVDYALPDLIARQGWIGVTIDPVYGGMGLGHLAKTLIIEELSRVSPAAGAIAQASQLGVAKIIHFGTDEQKKRWLPPIAAGKCLPTIAVTEPGSGSHVLGMAMEAKPRRRHWVLTGRKIYVGNSHVGHLHGVVARTGRSDSRDSRALTAFLVEADREGVSLVPHQRAMGLHGFSFGEIIFDKVLIPAENVLGEVGDGRDVADSSSLLCGRPNLTGVALGAHQGSVEETVRFVAERERYGAPLGDMPTIQQKLGAMQSRLMTARLTAYHAVHLLDQGQPCDAELMNAKLVNVEYALDSAREAMEIFAAAGLFTDRPMERFLRDAFHIFAPAGTSDVQRFRLAEHALGTAHRPWSERLAHLTRTTIPAGCAHPHPATTQETES